MKKVVTKVSLRDRHSDFAYWQTQSYQVRLYRHLLLKTSLLMLICWLGVGTTTAWPKHKRSPANQNETNPRRSDEKVVEKADYPGEPVEVENISIKNVKVALNRKFSARALAERGGGPEEDWLENLEVPIKNKSDKRITYLSISFGFPFAGSTDTSAGTYYWFIVGRDPRASGDAATYAEPFSLGAGESYTVRFSDKDLKEIKSRLAMVKSQLADVNRMILRITTIGYEDGVQWQLGKYSVPEKQRASDQKSIERVVYDREPYEITELAVHGVKVEHHDRLVSSGYATVPREFFEFSGKSGTARASGQEEEWLERLEFTFTNRSAKRVTYIGVELDFPETEVNGPLMAYRFSRGNASEAAKDPSNLSEALALRSGEATALGLTDTRLKSLKDFLALRKFQLADLNRAVVKVADIHYEDGTRWEYGAYYRPNPDKPGGYEKIVQ